MMTPLSVRSRLSPHRRPARGLGHSFEIVSRRVVLLCLCGWASLAHGQSNWGRPTHSSPIAISLNDRLIWVVNPSDDSVSVIRPDTNQRLAKIGVGHEPQSIALTPDGQYAYVANAAGGTVTVIRI